MAQNQKKKLEYTLEFKEDKQNRCVICWMDIESTSIYRYLMDRKLPCRFVMNVTIKTTARAHDGDPWDPEGLKRLARKKALRKLNLRMAKFFFDQQRELSEESEIAFREYTKFITRYKALDDEIAGHEYYDNWRKQETKE